VRMYSPTVNQVGRHHSQRSLPRQKRWATWRCWFLAGPTIAGPRTCSNKRIAKLAVRKRSFDLIGRPHGASLPGAFPPQVFFPHQRDLRDQKGRWRAVRGQACRPANFDATRRKAFWPQKASIGPPDSRRKSFPYLVTRGSSEENSPPAHDHGVCRYRVVPPRRVLFTVFSHSGERGRRIDIEPGQGR